MTTTEERMKILKMIQDGILSAEEGVQLIEALEEGSRRQASAPNTKRAMSSPSTTRAAKWFRVEVTDISTGKTRVNVRLPVGLVSAGVKMGARFAPSVEGLDLDVLLQHLNAGEIGKIIDVYSDDEGERVEVYIE